MLVHDVPVTESRKIGYSNQLGYSFCHDCKPEQSTEFAAEDGDACETCGCKITDNPVIIHGRATIEYFACKIY